jgi:hypothetical protein
MVVIEVQTFNKSITSQTASTHTRELPHSLTNAPQRTASPIPPINRSIMDLDETMTTSTPSTPHDEGYEEDITFNDDEPSTLSNGPQTPANDHLNAAAPGELSPPRSQQSPSEEPPPSIFAQTSNMANGTATRTSGRLADQQGRPDNSNFNTGAAGGGATGNERENEDAPGYGWKNKKAQEFGDVTMLSKGK